MYKVLINAFVEMLFIPDSLKNKNTLKTIKRTKY